MNVAASDYLASRVHESLQNGSSATDGGALEKAHDRTAKVVEQLQQARLSLERAAVPELKLSPAIRALSRTASRLDRPLRVAILGEINSGKSSLANLLAGVDSLPTAILANTRIPTLLYYAPRPEIWVEYASGRRERGDLGGDLHTPQRPVFRIDVGLPSHRLRTVQFLDLPGFTCPITGSVVVDTTAHHVDAAIWCTMSTQAWKESERAAWEMLPPRIGARGLLVATHGDLLRNPADRIKLMTRLKEEVGGLFRNVLLVSAEEALEAMAGIRTPTNAWDTSGATALEDALADLLIDLREQRAAAALRMTSRIAQRALTRIDSRLGLGAAQGHPLQGTL